MKAACGRVGLPRHDAATSFSPSRKRCSAANFIIMSYDSVLQTIGLLSTAIFLWVGANQVMNGDLSVGGFVAFSSLTAMAYAAILRTLGIWDQSAVRGRVAEPAQRYLRAGAGAGPRPLATNAGAQRWKAASNCATSVSNMAGRRRRIF